MLTLKMLEDMPRTVFASGFTVDSVDGVNMTNSGKKLRWVAIRGRIYDWAIYIHWATNPLEYIRDEGDKVITENHIRKLVECDNEAFNMYRY